MLYVNIYFILLDSNSEETLFLLIHYVYLRALVTLQMEINAKYNQLINNDILLSISHLSVQTPFKISSTKVISYSLM